MAIPVIPPSTDPSLQAYTLTYSLGAEGFPSFYSYIPEQIQGMNQYLYTFKNGNLYRHNSDTADRCTFYGTFTPCKVQGIINTEPTVVKVFKTIQLHSDDRWSFAGKTDLESGEIEGTSKNPKTAGENYFEEKEASYFAYIRGIDSVPVTTSELNLRSAQGIGAITSVNNTAPAAIVITYAANVLSEIITPNIPNPAEPNKTPDLFYFVQGGATVLGGTITGINLTNNTITVDSTTAIGGSTAMLATNYSFYVKNAIAESHGLRGFYLEFVVENNSKSDIELFTLSSDVMKSFP